MNRLGREAALAEAGAGAAEALRDELGRRVDLLEAANRCARALASSLEIDQAFGAFIRELRGLMSFDRVVIVLVEGGRAEVMAGCDRPGDEQAAPFQGAGCPDDRRHREAHGGSLQVDSVPRQGSVFTLELPVERA